MADATMPTEIAAAIKRMDECRAGCDVGEPFYGDPIAYDTMRKYLDTVCEHRDSLQQGCARLRDELEALQARIEDAPVLSVIEHAHLVAGEQITGIHDAQAFPHLVGKRVAQVRLGDDE